MSIPTPSAEEKELLQKAQALEFSRASMGAWILQCALQHCRERVERDIQSEADDIAEERIDELRRELMKEIHVLQETTGLRDPSPGY